MISIQETKENGENQGQEAVIEEETVENQENQGQGAVVEEDANSTNGIVIVNTNEDEEAFGTNNERTSLL